MIWKTFTQYGGMATSSPSDTGRFRTDGPVFQSARRVSGFQKYSRDDSVTSVISPEGCAAILWKSNEKKQEAAGALKLTAPDLKKLGIVDEIVPEPPGGAHAHRERMFEILPETGMLVLKNSGKAAGDLAKGILQKGGGVTEHGGDVLEQGVGVLKDGTDAVRDGVGGLFNLIPGVRVPERERLPEPEVKVPEEVKKEVKE